LPGKWYRPSTKKIDYGYQQHYHPCPASHIESEYLIRDEREYCRDIGQ